MGWFIKYCGYFLFLLISLVILLSIDNFNSPSLFKLFYISMTMISVGYLSEIKDFIEKNK